MRVRITTIQYTIPIGGILAAAAAAIYSTGVLYHVYDIWYVCVWLFVVVPVGVYRNIGDLVCVCLSV